jgi:hypothetical protein
MPSIALAWTGIATRKKAQRNPLIDRPTIRFPHQNVDGQSVVEAEWFLNRA